VDDFYFHSKIAEGGYSEVYEVSHTSNSGQRLAMKVMHKATMERKN
jgi:serine/threonine protein kinase